METDGKATSDEHIMPTKSKNRFLLLYGSQTGQAQAISEEIAEKAGDYGLVAELHCLSQTEKKFNIERESCVVFVISTTGDGDPPDTATKFIRRLKKKTHPENFMSHLNYTLLGLGDSNYTTFCNCGKGLDKVLTGLGAKHFYPPSWADDAVGLEVVVDPWIDGLWTALHNFLGIKNNSSTSSVVTGFQSDLNTSHLDSEIDPSKENHTQNHSTKNGVVEHDRLSSSNLPDVSKESIRTMDVAESASTCDNVSNLAINTNASSVISDVNIVSDARTTHITQTVTSRDISFSIPPNEIVGSSVRIVSQCTVTNNGCVPNIRLSVPPISDCSLTVPLLSHPFLDVKFLDESFEDEELMHLPLQNGAAFPSAQSSVVMAAIQSADILTSCDAIKKALKIKLDIKDKNIQYLPGDAISVICPNSDLEIEVLLKRLNLSNKSNNNMSLSVISDTKKKNAAIPAHLHPTSTLHHLLKTCVDIREPPKKAFLRMLVEYTSDEQEKRRLQELCSKQGATDYTKFVREAHLSILDVLQIFSTCVPPVERLLEHLPRLQPRPYSVCSSPLKTPESLEFVFNVVEIPSDNGRCSDRQGLCTGWINRKTKIIQQNPDSQSTIESQMDSLSISPHVQIPLFTRTNQHFHIPEDPSVPVVMIGPGTGVAPYIGFLHHRECQRKNISSTEYGETWLFFGCRHKERDYLFRGELEKFVEAGTLSELCVCFSRDEQPKDHPKYVQDNIRLHAKDIVRLLDTDNTKFFVCGDARNMARDVHETFLDILQQEKGLSESDAKGFMMQLKLHKRYLEDVWT